MALDRTTMKSFIDFGLWLNGEDSDILMLGDGFTELSEDYGADIQSTQYINQTSASSTVKGYSMSFTLEREFIPDAMQTKVNKAIRTRPTGEACETFYYRLFTTDKVDGQTNTYHASKEPIVLCPSSAGGGGGDILTTSLTVQGNGTPTEGTMTYDTVSKTWSFSAT